MLDITIVAVGKIKDDNIQGLIGRYDRIIKKIARLKLIEVESSSFSESDSSRQLARSEEGERLLKALNRFPASSVFLCEEKGKSFDSLKFSEFLNSLGSTVLVIAGPLGFGDDVKMKYKNNVSLSMLTFPHELARLILYEQIFRAAAILNNKTYHY